MRQGRASEPLSGRVSLLVLNKRILQDHTEAWTEADITQRSVEVADAICVVWPGPPGLPRRAANRDPQVMVSQVAMRMLEGRGRQ